MFYFEMKRLPPLLFVLFFSFSLFSQNDSTDHSKRDGKWEIGINFSPDYSYRILKSTGIVSGNFFYNQKINDDLADSLNSIEKGKPAFTAGISLSYSFSKNFSLLTGLYYSDKGIQSKGFVYASDVYKSPNYGYFLFKASDYKKTGFYFYEIPVLLHYTLNLSPAKKYGFHFFIGTAFSINSRRHDYISRRWQIDYVNSEKEESYVPFYVGPNSILYAGYIGGIGIKINTSKRISIDIEPTFKYYPYKFYSEKYSYGPVGTRIFELGFREKPYSYGCNLRLNYRF